MIGGLEGNTSYDVRMVGIKLGVQSGVTAPQTFNTLPVAPSIYSFTSSNLTADSADLHTTIHPHGTDTTYHFEYGTTSDYSTSTPDTDIGAATSPQSVVAHVDNLRQVVYHFRVVAHNDYGTVTSPDQTFNFFPSPCPNETLRQQSGSSYLPDCRGYELVSPSDAGAVVLTDTRPYVTLCH